MERQKMAKKRDRAKKPREPGPMDVSVMVCRDCGGQEFEAVYQVVWWSEEHPQNGTGTEMFQMHLWKYKCKTPGCGCEDAVLPPVFQAMRLQMQAAKNPMRIVAGSNKGDEGAAVEGGKIAAVEGGATG
jgi:hypothetical protein